MFPDLSGTVLERSPKSNDPTLMKDRQIDFQCHEQFLRLASDRRDVACTMARAKVRLRKRRREEIHQSGPVSVYLLGTREYRSYRSRMSRRAYLRASPTKVSGFLSARLTTRGDSRRPSPPPLHGTLRIQLSPFADTRNPDHSGDFPTTFLRPDFYRDNSCSVSKLARDSARLPIPIIRRIRSDKPRHSRETKLARNRVLAAELQFLIRSFISFASVAARPTANDAS